MDRAVCIADKLDIFICASNRKQCVVKKIWVSYPENAKCSNLQSSMERTIQIDCGKLCRGFLDSLKDCFLRILVYSRLYNVVA